MLQNHINYFYYIILSDILKKNYKSPTNFFTRPRLINITSKHVISAKKNFSQRHNRGNSTFPARKNTKTMQEHNLCNLVENRRQHRRVLVYSFHNHIISTFIYYDYSRSIMCVLVVLRHFKSSIIGNKHRDYVLNKRSCIKLKIGKN